MEEYIKKETAYRAIMGERPEAREPSWFAELVLEIPAVDAVEVVRCKDCAYCHPVEDLNYCDNPNAPWIDDPDFSEITVSESDFCSYGERKDGDGNG